MPKKKMEYFKNLGKKGGKATAVKHGADYMRKIGKKGGMATREKFAKNDYDSKPQR